MTYVEKFKVIRKLKRIQHYLKNSPGYAEHPVRHAAIIIEQLIMKHRQEPANWRRDA
jgi:hypothetical protein